MNSFFQLASTIIERHGEFDLEHQDAVRLATQRLRELHRKLKVALNEHFERCSQIEKSLMSKTDSGIQVVSKGESDE